MFSKTCEYGIKATLHIAAQSKDGRRVSLTEIAEAIDSPQAFTAKILQKLARHEIIDSLKGPTGGFVIARGNLDRIRLSHIVSAIDGESVYTGCALGLSECNAERPCPMHDKFKLIRDELKNMLESTSLAELALNLHNGSTYLKR